MSKQPALPGKLCPETAHRKSPIGKLLFLLLFIGFANASFAQTKKVTLELKSVKVSEALASIEKQTGYLFNYTDAAIDNNRLVSVSAKDVAVTEALDLIFKGVNVEYTFINDHIVLKKKGGQKAQGTVVGKVTDSKGEPLQGVNVQVKGALSGTTTTAEGIYSLSVADANAVIVFSSVGYTSQEIPAAGQSALNITLADKSAALNEVVIIGYGAVKKGDVTGAIGKVQMQDFEKAPVRSFEEAVAGRVAGVRVAGNDGQPGVTSNIIIRGSNSLTQDNSPLYVVDGFPLEATDFNAISPADIESIDVLKDASSTAIYGARGANGVIIITTKKGKKGAPVISYNGYFGLQRNNRKMELMSPYEFVKYQLEIDPVGATAQYLTNNKTLESYRNVKGLNLQDELYRVAPMQNHDLSLRGGSDNTRYSISGNVFQQDGIIIKSGFRRYQGRVVLDQTVNKKLKVGINANYSNNVSNGSVINSYFNTDANLSVLANVWGYRPVTGGDNDDALLDQLFDPNIDPFAISDYRVNPIISLKNELRKNTNNTLLANAYAEYAITRRLTLRISGGITNNFVRNESFNNSKTQLGNPRPFPNSKGVNGFVQDFTSNTWLNENTLTYNNVFNRNHSLNVVAGVTAQGNKSSNYRLEGTFLPNEALGIDGLDDAVSPLIQSNTSRWSLASFLGRVNYSYKSKYLFTASFRSDGSSRFPSQNKWSYFPSGSIAWRITGEEFMKPVTAISDAKLRFSYGSTGNNRVGDFSYLSSITFPLFAYYSFNNQQPTRSAFLSSIGNLDLRWETTTQSNLGLDVTLFKDRISLSADLYRKTTKDLLLNAQLPFTTGYQNAFRNIGRMQNQGLEISLSTVNLQGRDFGWSSNFNISFNQSKVLELTQGQDVLSSTVNFTGSYNNVPLYIAKIGQPVGQVYGAIFDGIYQYNDFDKLPDGRYVLRADVTTNGNARTVIQPGDMKYRDINGDLVVDAKDFTVIGRGLPIHTGGFTNNFTYKGFDLNVFFQWSYGNDIINANNIIYGYNGLNNRARNLFASYADRWTPENPSNTLPRATGTRPVYYGSNIVEDGSFVRLKTVSLGYNLGKGALAKLKLKSLRVYLSAQNLYTWTNYSGSDPEVSVRNSALTPGFDYVAYPRAQTVTFGINTSF